MTELLGSAFLGVSLSVAAYALGQWLQKKLRTPLANPLAIAVALIILLIAFTPFTMEQYQRGGVLISFWVVPATTALALQIHRQWKLLGQNLLPVLAGCLAGSAASMLSVWGMCRLFRLDQVLTATLLPKSVTSPIAMELAEKQGGIAAIAVSAVVFTGALCGAVAPSLVRLFRLKSPVGVGVATGTSGHSVGTAKALELGEIQGAISSISLCLSGVITSVLFLFL